MPENAPMPKDNKATHGDLLEDNSGQETRTPEKNHQGSPVTENEVHQAQDQRRHQRKDTTGGHPLAHRHPPGSHR